MPFLLRDRRRLRFFQADAPDPTSFVGAPDWGQAFFHIPSSALTEEWPYHSVYVQWHPLDGSRRIHVVAVGDGIHIAIFHSSLRMADLPSLMNEYADRIRNESDLDEHAKLHRHRQAWGFVGHACTQSFDRLDYDPITGDANLYDQDPMWIDSNDLDEG